MSNESFASPSAKCPLCGRPVYPGQDVCVCGAVVRGIGDGDLPGKKFDYGLVAPWVPLAGALLLGAWMFSPGMLVYSLFPVFKVYAVVVIITSVLCLLIAEGSRPRGVSVGDAVISARMTPLQWFGTMLIGWPVIFPAFLQAYYDSINPRRMKTGWINTGLFIVAILLLWIIASHTTPRWPAGTTAHKHKAGARNSAPPSAAPVITPPIAMTPPPASSNPPAAPAAGSSVAQRPAPQATAPGAQQPAPGPNSSTGNSNGKPGGGGSSYGLAVLRRRGD